MRWRLANTEVELRAAIESGLYDLYINNTDLEEAKRRVVAFLDGECVVSDSVDMEAYSTELREVLNELK